MKLQRLYNWLSRSIRMDDSDPEAVMPALPHKALLASKILGFDTDGNPEAVALTATNSVGTATNNNAAAGSIGEYVESEILVGGSVVALTTATAANVTSISLTAGDWDVWGNVGFTLNAATTMTTIIAWVSLTSAALPANPNKGGQAYINTTFTTGGGQLLGIPGRRFSLASTTTIYLSTQASFAVNTCSAFGSICARRVR